MQFCHTSFIGQMRQITTIISPIFDFIRYIFHQSKQWFFYPQYHNSTNQSNLYFIFFIPFLLTPFAPLYAYMLCVFIMVSLSAYITREFRIFLSLTMIFNIAVIYGSKVYFNTAKDYDDDFSRYYQNYLDIYDGISGAFFVWANGYEIGLPIFYKILSLVFPKLLPQQVLLITAFTIGLGFYLWLEIFILKIFKPYERSILVAFTLFIDIFFISLGLTRQCFATIFLLYAFSVKKIPLRFIFLAIAVSFHLSSIFVFIAYHFIKNYPRLSLSCILLFALFFMQDSANINSSINTFALFFKDYLPQRITTYFTHYIDTNGWNLYTLIYMPVMQIILMFCVIFSFFVLNRGDKISQHWRILALICFIISITKIFPERSTYIITSMLFYFVVFIAFRRFFTLTLFFFFPYFLKRMYYLLTARDVYGDSASYAFYSYPEMSFAPFYYLFQGVLQ